MRAGRGSIAPADSPDRQSGSSPARRLRMPRDRRPRILLWDEFPAASMRGASRDVPATPHPIRSRADRSDCLREPTRRGPSRRRARSRRWERPLHRSLHQSSCLSGRSRPPFCPTTPGKVPELGQPRNVRSARAARLRLAVRHTHQHPLSEGHSTASDAFIYSGLGTRKRWRAGGNSTGLVRDGDQEAAGAKNAAGFGPQWRERGTSASSPPA
jgi:hypothetical protein